MAAQRRKNQKQKDGYQRRFEDTDLVWLAEQFQKQVALNPDLTLEEFAKHYGVQPGLIKPFVLEAHPADVESHTGSTILWHGTTQERVKAILEEGFRIVGKPGKKIWFTRKANEARSIAKHRSQQRGEPPAVFCCAINLVKYSDFDRPNPNHYAFRHAYISREVIRRVSGPEKTEKTRKQPPQKVAKGESIDVTITGTSGRSGVRYWMNCYLEREDKEAISEEHPVVEAIYRWVEAQYAAGRVEPISDAEMAAQVRRVMGS